MAGINLSASIFSRPAIPVQFDMSAQILGGGSPLLPMEFVPPLLPGFGGPGPTPGPAPAPAPAEEGKKAKKGKKSKKSKKKDAKKPDSSNLNPALKMLGWEVDKNGLLKLSEKAHKDYANSVIGSYLNGAQQLGANFGAFLGAPM